MIQEEKIDLYRSQFGPASKSLFFTSVRGFGFLQNYLALARLAGTLGEPQ
jgi:hypothetical protein